MYIIRKNSVTIAPVYYTNVTPIQAHFVTIPCNNSVTFKALAAYIIPTSSDNQTPVYYTKRQKQAKIRILYALPTIPRILYQTVYYTSQTRTCILYRTRKQTYIIPKTAESVYYTIIILKWYIIRTKQNSRILYAIRILYQNTNKTDPLYNIPMI